MGKNEAKIGKNEAKIDKKWREKVQKGTKNGYKLHGNIRCFVITVCEKS
jgi:hypothetical protein